MKTWKAFQEAWDAGSGLYPDESIYFGDTVDEEYLQNLVLGMGESERTSTYLELGTDHLMLFERISDQWVFRGHTLIKRSEATVKTLDDWIESGLGLGEYLEQGDFVDDAVIDYFSALETPLTSNDHSLQVGVPFRHYQQQPLYTTFARIEGQWTWVGNQHKEAEIHRPL